MAETITGVPQGATVGLILFVTYVNGKPDHLPADSPIYADDGNFIAPVTAMTFSKAP